jgi:hypothetical protein
MLKVEPTTGIEPVNLFLTKEVLYRLSYVGPEIRTHPSVPNSSPVFLTGACILPVLGLHQSVERETGLEPATFSLEG